MKPFFRKLVDRITRRPPRVRLAGFGKHPGWDDHADIFVDTSCLIETRRALYTEGIGQNIEAGAWERLPPEQQLSAFGHTFAQSRSGEIQIGRLWASTDGKGRSRYPMILCADTQGVSLDRALYSFLPLLSQLQQTCQNESVAPGVVTAISAGEESLRAALAAPPSSDLHPPIPLAQCPELAGLKLPGLLYQIVRNLSPEFPLDRPSAVSKSLSEAPLHLRVPTCFPTAAVALRAWIEFLRPLVGERTPLLALMPDDQHFVDLILGPPAPEHLFCLLAAPAALPLTTDIPYNIPPEFLDRATRFLTSIRDLNAN